MTPRFPHERLENPHQDPARALGGRATALQLENATNGTIQVHATLARMKCLGLAGHADEKRPDGFYVWQITPRGVDWAEGRLKQAPGPFVTGSGGRPPLRFAATWLASLPRGIRLDRQPAAPHG